MAQGSPSPACSRHPLLHPRSSQLPVRSPAVVFSFITQHWRHLDTLPLPGSHWFTLCSARLCICQHQSLHFSSLMLGEPVPPDLPELPGCWRLPSLCTSAAGYLVHSRCLYRNPLWVLLSEWLSEDMLSLRGHWFLFGNHVLHCPWDLCSVL